ncbi:MAG TPA: hypothetical protein VL728_12415 [Cyclobacteriaceae bacterium]|nr:hypothetical protein [Cyclobacteriaceae bacterium]
MKRVYAVLISVLVLGCSYNNVAPVKPVTADKRITTEEYLVRDYSDPSAELFEKSFRREFTYEQNRLSQIISYDYNPILHNYTDGYKSDEFRYDSDGKLSQWVQFLGGNGLQRITEYDYSIAGKTTLTNSFVPSAGNKILEDLWIVTQTTSSLNVKYYQGDNQLYAELTCDIDAAGNITALMRSPSLPVGKVYYKYDNSPNPYYFPGLIGDLFSVNTYYSMNNYTEVTSDASTHAARISPMTLITIRQKSGLIPIKKC